MMHALADPGLQRRGAKFQKKFSNDLFLGVSPKISPFPPKIPSISSKFLLTFFLVIDPFCVLYMVFFHRGPNPQPTSIGGGKFLTFQQNHNTSIALSVPKGGQTPLPISMGGAMDGFAPLWIRHCIPATPIE